MNDKSLYSADRIATNFLCLLPDFQKQCLQIPGFFPLVLYRNITVLTLQHELPVDIVIGMKPLFCSDSFFSRLAVSLLQDAPLELELNSKSGAKDMLRRNVQLLMGYQLGCGSSTRRCDIWRSFYLDHTAFSISGVKVPPLPISINGRLNIAVFYSEFVLAVFQR